MTGGTNVLATTVVERLGWCLVHSAWQLCAVAVVAALELRGLRRSSARARYLAACAALGAMAILPLWTFATIGGPSDAGSTLRIVSSPSVANALPRSVVEPRSPLDVVDRERALSHESRVVGEIGSQPQPRAMWSEVFRPWFPWLVGAWGVGVLGFSLRLLGGWVWIQWLIRHQTRPVPERWTESLSQIEARMRIGRAVRLLESARVSVPMVVGWLRPVILLPVTALTGLPSDQLEAILAHELAHVRRYDYLVNLVQSVVETMLFYHPAAWWISGRIRAEREHCCDDQAVAVCGDRLVYTRALAALEEHRGAGWLLAPSAGDGSLLARVRRLLGAAALEERPASGLAGTLALAAVAMIGVVLFLAPPANRARAGVETGEAITGMVVTADGRPVAGADVWLVAHQLEKNQALTLGQARTDATGRYRLVPIKERLKTPDLGWRALYAHKTGMRPAAINQPDTSSDLGFAPGKPIRLTLEPSATVAFDVLDPSGRPVEGAAVAVVSLNEIRTRLPEELVERIGSRTGPDGRATMRDVRLDQIREVRVSTDSLGSQSFYAHNGFKPGETLRVRDAVRVDGSVTAADPAAVRGLPVHLQTLGEGYRDMTKHLASGEAWAVTDEQGRFHVPALATGRFFASVQVPEESRYRAPWVRDRDFTRSSRIEIELPLKRMVSVRGVVRVKGKEEPIAGAEVRFSTPELLKLMPKAITDSAGRYQAFVLPGPQSFCHLTPPKGYLGPPQGIAMTIGPGDGQTLPPIELDRGVTLRGLVIDDEGKPVAGAKVQGKWTQLGEPFKSPNGATGRIGHNLSTTATSNDRGEFLLEGIHPGANVMLEASLGNARTDRPQPAAAGTNTPVQLVISGANTVALFGQVVDTTGAPVAGALVAIQTTPLGERNVPSPHPVRFSAGEEIRTDRDGRFRTPREIARGAAYRAEVKMVDHGFMADRTPWLAIMADTRPFFPKLVLRRLRTVRGRVVDSHGQTVAGASVRQAGDGPAPTEARTDSQGRFTLSGVLAEPAFVFVAKPGYRFQGKVIGREESTMELALTREDEPPPKPLATLPPLLDRAAERVVLHNVFDRYAERAIKDGTRNERSEVFRTLVKLDPDRVLDLLGQPGLDPGEQDNIRAEVGAELVRARYEEARSLIEAIHEPASRSRAYSKASALLPAPARARKLDLLNEALIAARAAPDPTWRVPQLASVGEGFFDLGQTETASKVLREAEATASKLPVTGYSASVRGWLAEALAPIDLPAALNLLKGTEQEREHDRHLGHIAHELAGRNPAEAERLLRMMHNAWPIFRDTYTQRVCYRMVTVDPKRAMALAAGMTNYRYKARALGAMALALAETKKDQATANRLLHEAFAVLDEAVASNHDDWDGLGMACTVAAGLLPIIEQVDARRLPEFLGRTLALRPPIPGPNGRERIAEIAAVRVAVMAARYDRAIGRQVFDGFAERALARITTFDHHDRSFYVESLFQAAAIVAPARVPALIESLPESSRLARGEPRNDARLAVARILAREGADRWRYLERNLLHVWPIDSEEF